MQATDHISGKIGFIEGSTDGVAAFYIYVLAGPENEVAVFTDVHNYSEGVRAFDVPVGPSLRGGQIDTVCLGVASSGLTSSGGNPDTLAAASWIDVKLTGK